MSQRKVFGRLRFWDGKDDYKIEMRADAIWIRKRHSRKEWSVPFTWLLRFCHQQLEIFNEGEQKAQVPDMPIGPLVPTLREMGIVHESPERPAKDAEERRDGMAALIGWAEAQAARAGLPTPPPDFELPSADVGVVPGNDTGDVSLPGEPPGSPPLDTM